MSDLERKLRDLPFRTPPASWRRDILARAVPERNEPAWTWREWLWPSPAAWGAMAAIWILVLCLGAATVPALPQPTARTEDEATIESLYVIQSHRDLPALIESLN